MTPAIHIYNNQNQHSVPLKWLRSIAAKAVPLCLAAKKAAPDCVLPDLAEVEVSYITDEDITRVHAEFLDDATPTDVITFHHGEILISADTAVRQAADHSTTPEHEMALYLVHGLLHLAGWHDLDDAEAADMATTQERILAACEQP